ncbi:ABC transporter permease [Paenibacillus arenilitoris]|uniref:ABC transporter permease n=1 Tax=Paenibacillus arenilitoris TaxID=2772299 RepID=A0A927CLW7_9BACL|nr:ABC transporter permease [Paenibacillus arenilitoris]MBD2869964.1 ABC transporter permease [Paenibacillus arenilitoris]
MTPNRKGTCKKVVSKSIFFKKTVIKKTVCKPPTGKKCVGKKVRRVRSAFRAIAGTEQNVMQDLFTKVRFQVEEFDLNNEYNASTSTFRPRQSGIYSLLASVSTETITMTPYTLDLEIRVNGVPRISDLENFLPRPGIIDASGIVQLRARDRVEVFLRSTFENVIVQSGLATRFEGNRVSG